MTDVERVKRLTWRIAKILAGQGPEIQGAVLADLTAVWLASHYVENDADATLAMRSELLAMHCIAVRRLTEINAKIIETET